MEAELLKEKCESEVASVKPEVDKKIKKLTQKRDRALACVQRSADKKVATLERKREQYVRRLQSAEKRREAAERRREKVREKKTSRSALGTYEVEKCEREISSIKKEVRAIDDAIDKIKKETAQGIKNLEEEHRRAIAQEEAKIAQIVAVYQEKIGAKQRRIEEITKQTAVLTTQLDNVIDELKQNGAALQRQVEVDYRLDDPEKPTLVLLPVYLTKYLKEKDERFTLFSPIAVSEEGGVLDGLRKIITFNSDPKIKGLTRPISKRLHDVLTANLTGRMQADGEFKNKINTLGRNNNLVDTDEFSEILNVGLDELVERNLMTAGEAQDICRRISGGEA
jgi:bacterioferritin (cytochrome b1)